MSDIKPPAPHPCGSCPYRRDVASGVWHQEEYEKLPRYDGPTGEQPPRMFMCHQQDGCLCAGWTATHDMEESLGFRIAAAEGRITDIDAVLDYETTTPLFDTGAEAAEHGLANLLAPDEKARRTIDKLVEKDPTRLRQ